MKRFVTILTLFVFVIVPNVISQERIADISLYKPVNGEMGVSTTPIIRWQSNIGDVYQIQLSRINNFTSIAMSMTVPASTIATEIMVGGLEYNTTYFWRVKNATTPVWSTVYTFSTSSAQLGSAVLTTPPNGVTIAYSSALPLEWNMVDFATGYDVQVCTTQDFNNNSLDIHVENNVLSASSLKDNNTYYWRVRATHADYKGEWSSVARFNVGVEIQQVPPSPVLATPVNGAVNAKTTQTLTWQPVRNAVSYEVEVSPTPQFLTVTHKLSSENITDVSVKNLSPNMKYFWRVKSLGMNGISTWSSAYTFTTGKAPYAPALANPQPDVTVVANGCELAWNSVHDATGYHIQVSTSSNFKEVVFEEHNVKATTIRADLPSDQLLFWRVQSENEFGTGTWSPWRYFKTNNTINVVTKESDLHLKDVSVSPNPGGSVVTINYTVPSTGNVMLTIFDEMGNPTITLVNGIQNTGSYSVPVVTQNILPGAYLYHLTFNGIIETGKFVIIK